MAGFVALKSGCWQWVGRKWHDYGVLKLKGRLKLAHRWMYGDVCPGKELHHICGNKACVNPIHLVEVSRREHVILDGRGGEKKTHCRKGHLLDSDNNYKNRRGEKRRCRTCALEIQKRYHERIGR